MARHRLTTSEQKKGVEKALQSPRTPSQLKKGLKKRQSQLEGKSSRASEQKAAAAEREDSREEQILDEDEWSEESVDED